MSVQMIGQLKGLSLLVMPLWEILDPPLQAVVELSNIAELLNTSKYPLHITNEDFFCNI